MTKARKVDVVVMDNGDLEIQGLGVVENPFKEVEFPEIDKGELWMRLWAEGLINNPHPGRIRAILMNLQNLSVSIVLDKIKEA